MEVVDMTRNTQETMANKLTPSFTEDDIQYWIYEIWMTEAKKNCSPMKSVRNRIPALE